jgi:hypothetical protein
MNPNFPDGLSEPSDCYPHTTFLALSLAVIAVAVMLAQSYFDRW